MGNSIGCYGLGGRLAAAAREGDAPEAKRLLSAAPALARYTSFGALNSPLHFASAKGHFEVVMLLLQNGADVNSRNIYGQTPLMQACRFGHWEVVQTLLVFGSNVLKAECLGNKTALYYATAGGHIRCIRLLLADLLSSDSDEGDPCKDGRKDIITNRSLLNFVNKPTSGDVTALHVAALNGHSDCVHLLLDMGSNANERTVTYASSSVGSIGAGSTPLHYAACGGHMKCCQLLISRGASRSARNCNGWLPIDVARMWGCSWLEPLLAPKSTIAVPKFMPSSYRSLPLTSILQIAREFGPQLPLEPLSESDDDGDVCAVCLEWSCDVAADVCGHEFCVRCALNVSSTMKADDGSEPPGLIPCPLCRRGVSRFRKLPSPAKEHHLPPAAPGSSANSLVHSLSSKHRPAEQLSQLNPKVLPPANPLSASAVHC